MHRVSRLKPVVIDESLTDWTHQVRKQQGYSGIAIRPVKASVTRFYSQQQQALRDENLRFKI